MHLHLYFHELLLTLGSSYFKLLGWISKEKAVMNTKKTMSSTLNGLFLQHHITKRLLKFLNVYQSCSIIKINTTGSRL